MTAVGMFGQEPQWFLPHGSGTVLLTVGGIERTWVWDGEGHVEKEHLCLTGTFDHAVIDGAPAARFMSRLLEILRKGP
ncbi:MAG: 2-oxo acid dehydrogenase subunit E2 [Bacteroidales bacterium]